jgi:hypothetical protein
MKVSLLQFACRCYRGATSFDVIFDIFEFFISHPRLARHACERTRLPEKSVCCQLFLLHEFCFASNRGWWEETRCWTWLLFAVNFHFSDFEIGIEATWQALLAQRSPR